jgi:hypothetical protein
MAIEIVCIVALAIGLAWLIFVAQEKECRCSVDAHTEQTLHVAQTQPDGSVRGVLQRFHLMRAPTFSVTRRQITCNVCDQPWREKQSPSTTNLIPTS